MGGSVWVLLNAGFRPCRRGPFVSAKGPKTISARARPFGSLRLRTESRWLGNSLRSNSPRREADSVRSLRRARRQEDTQKILILQTGGWVGQNLLKINTQACSQFLIFFVNLTVVRASLALSRILRTWRISLKTD